jgi:ribonuclease HI
MACNTKHNITQSDNKGTYKKGFSFVQINLQHSKMGTASLCRTLGKLQTYICLIQEPWAIKNKVCGLNGQGNILYYGGASSPRTAVITSSGIKVSPLLEFCNRDVTAVRTEWCSGPVVLASVYMDGLLECPPVNMKRLVEHCSKEGLPLIVGADANAHHTLWGSTNINDRGVDLLDYLASSNMHVINQGHKPTFVVKNRKEVLDITLASSSVMHCIKRWRVDDDESSSDHRYIRAQVNVGRPEPTFGRNRKKANWLVYDETLKKELVKVSCLSINSTEDLDRAVDKITKTINDAFSEACPLQMVRPRGRKVAWWTNELTILRRESRSLYRYGNDDEEAWLAYKQARARYHTALRKAKRSSWRAYCEQIEEYPTASRLVRVLRDDKFVKLGALETSNGFTKTIGESYRLLLEQHFPADTACRLSESNHEKSESGLSETIVTDGLLKRAVQSFGPYKASGSDNIFPALMQKGLKHLSPFLIPILRACIDFGYMPQSWRKMRIIFLPKPGKDSYQRASSWRPISLTSFLLKTLERLIDWYIRTPQVVRVLRKFNQFAYLRGVSTEAALHQIVARIERALKSGEFAMGLFLDIKGAFSDATFESLITGLGKFGVNKECVRFIHHMLTSRTAEALHYEEVYCRVVERGCPQGGVLSPLLWNLVVAGLLQRLSEHLPQTYSQGFADDVASVASGRDLGIVTEHIQRALNISNKWCKEMRLSLNDKSSLVLFTNKRKFVRRPILLNGVTLPYCETVRYLGVILDEKLTWTAQCRARVAKATIALAQCRRAVSKSWGLSPKICRWIYEAVVRPAVEYAALVWLTASESKTKMARLNSAQRNALLSVSGGMRSCPTATLECMHEVLPLNLRLKQVALQTQHRLSMRSQWLHWQGVGYTKAKTHIDICCSTRKEISVMEFPCDCDTEFLDGTRKFEVKSRSRKDWKENGQAPEPSYDVAVYTDGSKLEGQAGAAYVVLNAQQSRAQVQLGSYATVFQAELIGIQEACANVSTQYPPGTTIGFYVDSRSVLDALCSMKRQTGLVRDVFRDLQKLASVMEVCLNWIPSHHGYEGNELVDALAKEATKLVVTGPLPVIPLTTSTVKSGIKCWARAKHVSEWKNRSDCRHSKLFIQVPYSGQFTKCRPATRNHMRFLTQVVTGHSALNGHLFKMGLVDSPVCSNCEQEEETVAHYLGVCEKYCALRFEMFGAHTMGLNEVILVPWSRLTRFIVKSGRFGEVSVEPSLQ